MDNMYIYVAIAIISVLVVLWLVWMTREGMYYYNQYYKAFEQRHPSPDCFRFFGREKPNVFGYDQSDYFLRNQLEYEQGLGPDLHGWSKFEARDKAFL